MLDGNIFSVLDLVWAFHQTVNYQHTVPLGALRTPTRLLEWLVMPPGATAAPGWCAGRISDQLGFKWRYVLRGRRCGAPLRFVRALEYHQTRLRTHSLVLSPAKARLGAADLHFSGIPFSLPVFVPTPTRRPSSLTCPCLLMHPCGEARFPVPMRIATLETNTRCVCWNVCTGWLVWTLARVSGYAIVSAAKLAQYFCGSSLGRHLMALH